MRIRPRALRILYNHVLHLRFRVISRTRGGTSSCPLETFDIVGPTGDVHTVHIGPTPRCDCPPGPRGKKCSHVLFVCPPAAPAATLSLFF